MCLSCFLFKSWRGESVAVILQGGSQCCFRPHLRKSSSVAPAHSEGAAPWVSESPLLQVSLPSPLGFQLLQPFSLTSRCLFVCFLPVISC